MQAQTLSERMLCSATCSLPIDFDGLRDRFQAPQLFDVAMVSSWIAVCHPRLVPWYRISQASKKHAVVQLAVRLTCLFPSEVRLAAGAPFKDG